MEKIDIGHIKTIRRFRNGIDQIVKLYNKTQKKEIINQVQIGVNVYNMRVEDIIKMYEVSPAVYYYWVRRFKTRMRSVVFEDSNQVMISTPIEIQRISLSVDIHSTEELFRIIHDLCKIKGVKSVSA